MVSRIEWDLVFLNQLTLSLCKNLFQNILVSFHSALKHKLRRWTIYILNSRRFELSSGANLQIFTIRYPHLNARKTIGEVEDTRLVYYSNKTNLTESLLLVFQSDYTHLHDLFIADIHGNYKRTVTRSLSVTKQLLIVPFVKYIHKIVPLIFFKTCIRYMYSFATSSQIYCCFLWLLRRNAAGM